MRNRRARAASWLYTGPLGHLYAGTADVVLLLTRYALARAKSGHVPGTPRSS